MVEDFAYHRNRKNPHLFNKEGEKGKTGYNLLTGLSTMAAFKFNDNENNKSLEAEIPWATAVQCHDAYMAHPDALKLAGGGPTILKGFSIPIADVMEALEQQGHNIDRLYVMLGISPDDLDETDPDNQNFTVIIGGIKPSSTNPAGELITAKVYDFAVSCPTRCPDNA